MCVFFFLSRTLFQRWWNWYEIAVVANFYIYIYIHNIHACTYSLFVTKGYKGYDSYGYYDAFLDLTYFLSSVGLHGPVMVVALWGFSRGPGGKTTTSIFGVLFGYTRGGKTNQEGRGH